MSFIPAMPELTSFWYLPVAALMGGYFLWMAFRFAISGTDQAARLLFVASIVYFAYNARSPRFCTIVKKAESLEVPAIIAVGGLEPSKRVFEFFTVPIRNKNPDS